MDVPPASHRSAPQPPSRPDRHPDDLPPFEGERRVVPRGLAWAAVLFVLVLAIASWRSLSAIESPSDDVAHLDNGVVQPGGGGLRGIDIVGKSAPAASFTAFDGRQRMLADYAGKPIVVNFWSSTCPPCVTEMPAFEKVHQQFGDRVAFLGIDTVDGETPARALAARTGVTYDLGFDPDGSIAKSFGVINLPTTVLITADGRVVYSNFGERSAEQLTQAINEKLLP